MENVQYWLMPPYCPVEGKGSLPVKYPRTSLEHCPKNARCKSPFLQGPFMSLLNMVLQEAAFEVLCVWFFFFSPPPFIFLAYDRLLNVECTWWSRLYIRGRPDALNEYFFTKNKFGLYGVVIVFN